MSELGEIHEKINQTRLDVSYIKGKLDTLIPTLATKADVEQELSEHKEKCSKSNPKRFGWPNAVTLIVALVGFGGFMWQMFN